MNLLRSGSLKRPDDALLGLTCGRVGAQPGLEEYQALVNAGLDALSA